MKIYLMPQYSPEWWEVRRGIPTASAFDRILTPTGKLSTQAESYIDELIADRLNQSPNFFTERGRAGTPEMQFGRDTEPEARRFYLLSREEHMVDHIGFALSDCGRWGCSPDGIVIAPDGTTGGLELKCPKLTTQVGYLRKHPGQIPPEYRPQIHGQLIVTGWPWVDFLSYTASAPPLLVRVYPDEYTERLRKALEEFHERYIDAADRVLGRDALASEGAEK